MTRASSRTNDAYFGTLFRWSKRMSTDEMGVQSKSLDGKKVGFSVLIQRWLLMLLLLLLLATVALILAGDVAWALSFAGGRRCPAVAGARAGGERFDAVEVRGLVPKGPERHLQAYRGTGWRRKGEERRRDGTAVVIGTYCRVEGEAWFLRRFTQQQQQ